MEDILAKKAPKELKDFFTNKEWESLKKEEPMLDMMASATWQDPANFATVSTTASILTDYFPQSAEGEKPGDINRYNLQKLCWQKYKTFGPLNAAIDSKAGYIAGNGFSIYSDILEVNEFLKDLISSLRNKIYARAKGWAIRMMAETELFLLLAIDEEGTATTRVLEPDRIGDMNDSGLITDPDDVTQTLFYKHKPPTGELEWIPDARFVVEPEYMIERQKALKDDFDKSKISALTAGKGGRFSKIGGYRRFVLHWKNLTGVLEYTRDTSALSTTLEWINLYIMAKRWRLDHLKSLSAYTISVKFTDTPAGKVAWNIWSKMTPEQKDKTGLTKPLTPGSKVFLMPGIDLEIKNPQLGTMSGADQDLLNLAGAGLKTPQDMFQGQSGDSSYAAIKSSRPPLVADIEELQTGFENFLRYEFLRTCFAAKVALGGKILGAGKSKYKLLESYKQKDAFSKVDRGKADSTEIEVEPCLVVNFTWPTVKLVDDAAGIGGLMFGSKHTGLRGAGVSEETLAKKAGVDGLSRERRRKQVEIEEYGEPEAGLDAEQKIEEKPIEGKPKKGAEAIEEKPVKKAEEQKIEEKIKE